MTMAAAITNIKTAVKAYICRRKYSKEERLRLRRINAAERDIQVREYKQALWLAYKGVPLVPVQTIGNDDALYSTLKLARENYIDCELIEIIR